MKILVTGGLGFIGSNFVRHLLDSSDYEIINFDKLTYAGNPENLRDVENNERYSFVKGDICDREVVEKLVPDVDVIINFAAETHVDRSIGDPASFIKTDIFGTYTLLEAARKFDKKFIQISTDEVYGNIEQGSSREEDVLMPSNPYSASKAGADRLAFSYFVTYRLPVIITRSSNNYGPYQYPEKLIPLFVTNLLEGKKVPLYGDGLNKRDWIYVLDNCRAISFLMEKGKPGEVYNIGAGEERTNLEITKLILQTLGKTGEWVEYVKDRPGHDKRYSLDCSKIQAMGWKPSFNFSQAMKQTIEWYKNNQGWWKRLKSGEYLEYYRKHYKERHQMKG